jgi:hypothetical protein
VCKALCHSLMTRSAPSHHHNMIITSASNSCRALLTPIQRHATPLTLPSLTFPRIVTPTLALWSRAAEATIDDVASALDAGIGAKSSRTCNRSLRYYFIFFFFLLLHL